MICKMFGVITTLLMSVTPIVLESFTNAQWMDEVAS